MKALLPKLCMHVVHMSQDNQIYTIITLGLASTRSSMETLVTSRPCREPS